MRTTILISGLAAAVAACGGDSTTCGTGTTKQGNECIADNGGSNSGSNQGSNTGSGNDTTCGAGTHLDGTMCVPDDMTVQAAPTVTAIDPPAAGIGGFDLFTITGTGFAGSNVTDLHVFFGDPTNMNCEAQVGAATATTIAGEIPPGCTLSSSVTVTVTTNLGTATIPFNYEMILAADGLGGGGAGWDFWIIDPFSLQSFDMGPLQDANMNWYSLSGMDFDASGVLWAVTSGASDTDATINGSQLVTIDLSTLKVTSIAETKDAANEYYIRDIKFLNGTLYGWASYNDGTNNLKLLVSINTTDGTVTQIGSGTPDDSNTGGMTVDGNGALIVAGNGVANDPNAFYPTTGEIDSVDTTTGALSNKANVTWDFGAEVQAMATFPGTTPKLIAVVDNGSYGAQNGVNVYGETLAILDVDNEAVNPVLELPSTLENQSHVDALAVPPSTLVISRQLPRSGWKQLKASKNAVALPRKR